MDESLPASCQTMHKDTTKGVSPLHIIGYKLHINGNGRGKGLATYFKENKFAVKLDITNEDLQITILESENLCVIGLYRSNADRTLCLQLQELIPAVGNCLIIGDFNLCTRRSPSHDLFITLKSLEFKLLVSEATHLDGGHLDQAWLRIMHPSTKDVHSIELYSPYYNCKDHDALLFSFYDPRTEQGGDF